MKIDCCTQAVSESIGAYIVKVAQLEAVDSLHIDISPVYVTPGLTLEKNVDGATATVSKSARSGTYRAKSGEARALSAAEQATQALLQSLGLVNRKPNVRVDVLMKEHCLISIAAH